MVAKVYTNLRHDWYFSLLICASPVSAKEHFQLSPETILHPEKREKVKVRNVAIVPYDGVEFLEFADSGEVLAAAQKLTGKTLSRFTPLRRRQSQLLAKGLSPGTPQCSFADAPKADIMIFPGGNIGNFLNNKTAMSLAKVGANEAEIAMSICTGALVLADLGLTRQQKGSYSLDFD